MSRTVELQSMFEQVVANTYAAELGIHDAALTNYIAGVLSDFTQTEQLYRVRDASGRPLHRVEEMLVAADPVNGTATSFDAERKVRKHIGDYALFLAGMYPESRQQSVARMVKTGKESYYIVSKFDLFEYADEAPLFARLSDWFERCTYGLTLVRRQLGSSRLSLSAPRAH